MVKRSCVLSSLVMALENETKACQKNMASLLWQSVNQTPLIKSCLCVNSSTFKPQLPTYPCTFQTTPFSPFGCKSKFVREKTRDHYNKTGPNLCYHCPRANVGPIGNGAGPHRGPTFDHHVRSNGHALALGEQGGGDHSPFLPESTPAI